jgi:hypothetical protein
LNASTAKAFSVVSFSTASIFRARQPSVFMRVRIRIAGARSGGLWLSAHGCLPIDLRSNIEKPYAGGVADMVTGGPPNFGGGGIP